MAQYTLLFQRPLWHKTCFHGGHILSAFTLGTKSYRLKTVSILHYRSILLSPVPAPDARHHRTWACPSLTLWFFDPGLAREIPEGFDRVGLILRHRISEIKEDDLANPFVCFRRTTESTAGRRARPPPQPSMDAARQSQRLGHRITLRGDAGTERTYLAWAYRDAQLPGSKARLFRR